MEYFKIKYTFSQVEFEKKFLERTIKSTIYKRVTLAYSKANDRLFYGAIRNKHIELYTVPNAIGPRLNKPWKFISESLAIWACPTYIFGTIVEDKGQTVIDCYITKRVYSTMCLIFAIIMSSITLVGIVINILQNGLSIQVILSLLLVGMMFSMAWLTTYIPKSERNALIKFMNDLEY